VTRSSGIAALALASITVGLLLATGTVAADTVDGSSEKQRGRSEGGTDAQSEYTRLLALARANQKAVSEQQGRIDVAGLPAIGSTDAVLAIVEFSSFQCGYCHRHFAATMPLLRAHYVDTGRLRYFFRDLALQPSQQHAELEPVTLRMSLHDGPVNDLKAR
jgi:protein-disulfide isomerase